MRCDLHLEAGEPPSRKHQKASKSSSVLMLVGKSGNSVERRNEPKGRQGITTSFKKVPAVGHERGERTFHYLLYSDDFDSCSL